MMWFRMYQEFATDPRVQMMSEADQRRFVMLLCLKCRNGDVTLQDEEVAFQLRISDEEWAQTKARFLAKKLILENNSPSTWDKRQYVSDSSTERVARHRANKKQGSNVTATPPDPEADTETEEEKEAPLPIPRGIKTPEGGVGGVLKNGNGGFDILHLLTEDGLAEARKAADGWDIYRLAGIYNKGAAKRGGRPSSPDKAFAGWCAKYTKGRPPA